MTMVQQKEDIHPFPPPAQKQKLLPPFEIGPLNCNLTCFFLLVVCHVLSACLQCLLSCAASCGPGGALPVYRQTSIAGAQTGSVLQHHGISE